MPFTFVLIAIWLSIWITTAIYDISPMLCGKGICNIGNEYYRFFTAGLTHTNVFHLLANVSAMFWLGYLFEHFIGSIKFAIISIFCSLSAQILFLCIYRYADSCIGGSVYTFSLCGSALVARFVIPNFPKVKLGTWSGNWITIYFILSNIPYLIATDITAIVIHAIAFVCGAIAGFVYWFVKWITSQRKRTRNASPYGR